MARAHWVLVASLWVAPLAVASVPTRPAAAKPKPKASKVQVPSFQLELGEGVPKPKGLRGAPAATAPQQSSLSAVSATYRVVSVRHAKTFSHGPQGATAVIPLEKVAIRGTPPQSEKFTSALRVKCPQKVDTSIDVAILDERGNTALSATGQLRFPHQSDEVDYTIDWEPTPFHRGGDFRVQVRIGGQTLGTYPLKFQASSR